MKEQNNKWFSFRPIAYIGLIMGLIGILGPSLFGIKDALIKFIGVVIFIIGMYLLMKGRKEN